MLDYFLQDITIGKSLLGLALVWTIAYWIRHALHLRKVHSLGGHANAFYPTYAPLGLDFAYRGLTNALKNQNLQFWHSVFVKTGAIENESWTSEVYVNNLRLILTSHPDNIKAVLTGQFEDYGKGEIFHREWFEFLGDSIFTTDHKMWHDSRQLIRPMFVRERFIDLDVLEKHISKLLPMLSPVDGMSVQIDELLFSYTLDAATEFLLGSSVGSLENPQVTFAEAFREVQRVQSLMTRAGPMKHFIPLKSFRAGIKTIDTFIQKYIDQVLAMNPEELNHKFTKSDTFITALAQFTRDPKVLRDQLYAILLAGRDTTATTLSWAFYELGRRPEYVAKLRAEIKAHLGDDPTNYPTYANIKDMKYLTAVINETLRLYPAVPFNIRRALKDTTLPVGGGPDGKSPIGMDNGTIFTYSTLHMQRRRDMYPSDHPYDPEQWHPDRWFIWQPKPWHFIPFNGGPRICIGQQFAMVEMGYTLVRILQTYTSVKGRWGLDHEPVLAAEVVLLPGMPIDVVFGRRKDGVQ